MPDTDEEEDKCPICLSEINNPAQPENCKHLFCLEHLRKWATEKTTCPLCNAEFRKMFYDKNRKTGKWRKTEEVRPPRCPDDMAAMGFENSWPRIWRSNNDAQVINEMIRAMEEQRARNTRQWEARFGRTTTACLRARRTVYRSGRRVELTFQREFSPEFYQANEAQTHRLTPWIRREVVCIFGCVNRQFLDTLIIDIQHNMVELGIDSREFREFIAHHFHGYASHFIHELKGFACAKDYDVRNYDRNAKYGPAKEPERRSSTRMTPGAPERIMPENDPEDPTPILVVDSDEEPGPSGLQANTHAAQEAPRRSARNRGPQRISATIMFEHFNDDSSDADGDAATPPRLDPDQPVSLSTGRPIPAAAPRRRRPRREGVQMAQISITAIGDSDPLLNPINIPVHPREGRGEAFLPHRRNQNRTTIASRVYDEMRNREEADAIVIEDFSSPPRPTIHRSRLEMELNRQVINLVNSDSDDEESVSALNPPIPSNAFLPASSASTSIPINNPKRANTVVILSDSDNNSDIELITPKEKRTKFDEDPIDINQPGPSGLNLK